ncbi:FtsW/RodA/SpoVE family cell cycle protein [Bacillus sp. SM2101]|uniref:FtsW/RodA/SpoVE family cell cycle protein n=1 Tax=Bacillus sp. SM2101 TaxID=2805366 RepID=UPI001BDF6AAF|nr:FtsW/RodA/SpoVE family cell cycle protein [Bacillus sp. SM2101]
MEKEKTQPKIDYMIVLLMILFVIYSCIAIYSANSAYVTKQIVWYVIGLVAILVTMIIDFDRFRQISWILYGLGMLLLLGLEIIPEGDFVKNINGATSWYQFPGGLGSFQPSEVMKIFLIILLSQIVFRHNEKYPIRTLKEDLLLFMKIMLISGPPLLLVMMQPDLGTAMVLSAIIASIILVSGIKWRYIAALFFSVILVISIVVLIYFLNFDFFVEYFLGGDSNSYTLGRFYGWLAPYEYPTQGFQLLQSLLAIGSGELVGRGYMTEGVRIPEAHTDFIFAIIAEEFGFIGACLLISIFFLLIYRIIHTALESNDPYGSYLCTGIIGMITFQVFQNIGMTIGLLPITGIPLPFISYGGSSLLTYMIAIGIVLNVRSRTIKFMFD